MTTIKIVPGGERVGTFPASGPALRAKEIGPMSVLRRCGRRPALSFSRRNERPVPAWGDDPRTLWQRIDWGYVAFAIGWATVAFALTYIAVERGAT